MIVWEKINDKDGEVSIEFNKEHTKGEIYIREAPYPQRIAALSINRKDVRELRDALTAWLEDELF